MHWLSIAYFFVTTLTTGTLIDIFVRNWEADWLERLIMRFGVGLAAFSVEGVILNLLHIPLDYRVFLAVGILVFIGAMARNKRLRSFKAPNINLALTHFWKSRTFWYSLFMLVLFAVTAKMYIGGTFKYDYFEDTDPWRYTAAAQYIGEYKTFTIPYHSTQYNEPYAQGYQIVMGVLSQTNDSIYWTMKFFSTLIISFGVLFMYYFARRFTKNEEIAVIAGLFLFAVPAWVTHFIYSNHFNMTIFVVCLYVLAQLMSEFHRKASESPSGVLPTASITPSTFRLQDAIAGWMPIGIIVYASMLVNHFTSVLQGSLFCFALIVTRILAEKKIHWETIMVFPGGFLLSLLYYIPAYSNHWELVAGKGPPQALGGVEKLFPFLRFLVTPLGMGAVVLVMALTILIYRSRLYWQSPLERWLGYKNRAMFIWLCGLAIVLIALLQPVPIVRAIGTDDQRFSYTLGNFFSATWINRYHNPIGLGFVLMSTVICSFLLASTQLKKWFEPANSWVAVSYTWLITAFLLVLGKYFSIAIIPFRAWTFLGLFASLFGAWGFVSLIQMATKSYRILLGAMILLAIIVIPTSFFPKWKLNTIVWSDAKIGKPQSEALFAWMRNGGIPKNSVVAHLCGDSEFLSGYDMNPPLWDKTFHPEFITKVPYFVAHPLKLTPEAYTVLKNARVKYVTVGTSCLWQTYGKQRQSIANQLPQALTAYMKDSRLQLIKTTGYEFLFKLK